MGLVTKNVDIVKELEDEDEHMQGATDVTGDVENGADNTVDGINLSLEVQAEK